MTGVEDSATTPWSALGDTFLSDGDWAIGQGVDAPDRQLFRELLRGFLPRPNRPNLTLLEIGSGPGIEVEGLQRDGLLAQLDYVGYDLTPELVEVCRNRYPACRFEVVDVQAMGDERIADVVWCRHVLEHVSDWARALRNVYAAASEAALVSWFIRPTWRETDVGCGVADGFLHHTVSARRAVALVAELGAHLYRFDFDHHSVRGSVWLLTRMPCPDLAEVAHRFLASEAFLESLLDVPLDSRDREHALTEVVRQAEEALTEAASVMERIWPWYWTLARVKRAANHCRAVLGRDQADG